MWPSDEVWRLPLYKHNLFTADASEQKFHHDLQEGEREELASTAEYCEDFCKLAAEWMKARNTYGFLFIYIYVKHSVNHTQFELLSSDIKDDDPDLHLEADFLAAIQAPVEEEELVSRCEFYLCKVEKVVEALVTMFSAQSQ